MEGCNVQSRNVAKIQRVRMLQRQQRETGKYIPVRPQEMDFRR